jgi:hypothetical protein
VNLKDEFARACALHADRGFDDLLEHDKVLVTIWALEADVNNGGFDQYYFNSSGDTAFFAPEALRLIGAHRTADIVRAANARFGSDGPPRDPSLREDVLFQLTENDEDLFEDCDRAFYDYPDDLDALLVAYLGRVK